MDQQVFGGEHQSLRPARPVGPAMCRGFLGRCPHCGEGRLFGSWLKTVHACDHCGEALDQHRADDFPAYLVIVIVGHLVVPLILHVEMVYEPAYWVHAVLWLPLTLALSLLLIQPIKGMVIAMQWRIGMHGFDAAKKLREAKNLHEAKPSPAVV